MDVTNLLKIGDFIHLYHLIGGIIRGMHSNYCLFSNNTHPKALFTRNVKIWQISIHAHF